MPKGVSTYNQTPSNCRHCGAAIKLSGRGSHEKVCVLTPAQKFWRHVVKGESCWEYTKSVKPDGYRFFRYRAEPRAKQVQWYAHRFSYTLAYGPIPEGMDVCHRCDNTACVNPAHLFLGTASENMVDMYLKGRDGCTVLTPDQVREVRRLLAEGKMFQKDIGALMGVKGAIISGISLGRTYQWVK